MIIESAFSCPEQGSFRVPNRVVDLLTEAGCPASYLAVYLFALRQACAGNFSISNEYIAEGLHLSTIDVVNAFMFFNTQGLLKIHRFTSMSDADFDIEFCFDTVADHTPIPFRPSYKSSEISRRLKENPRMAQMYKMVGQMLGKTLSSADTELLYSFHDYYGLPIEVILVLIEYYVSKDKRSMKYMEKEAGKWVAAGIDTVEKAKAYIEKREAFLSYAGRVRAIIGIQERRLSSRELTYVNDWQNKFKMPLEMVKSAFELTVNKTGKLSFAYMNKILEAWADAGIRKQADLKKEQKTTDKTTRKSDRYNFAELERQAFQAVNNQ